jgi:hypothetical protein
MDKNALAASLDAQLVKSRTEVWTQDDAISLCVAIESIAPTYGCHVALTGGSLYKRGLRKDADILFYRIRQVDEINESGLLDALSNELGMIIGQRYGWVVKAEYCEKPVDLFFPESKNNERMSDGKEYGDKAPCRYDVDDYSRNIPNGIIGGCPITSTMIQALFSDEEILMLIARDCGRKFHYVEDEISRWW